MGVFHQTDSMWFQMTDTLAGIICFLQMATYLCMQVCLRTGTLMSIIMDPPALSEKHFTLVQPSAETDRSPFI